MPAGASSFGGDKRAASMRGGLGRAAREQLAFAPHPRQPHANAPPTGRTRPDAPERAVDSAQISKPHRVGDEPDQEVGSCVSTRPAGERGGFDLTGLRVAACLAEHRSEGRGDASVELGIERGLQQCPRRALGGREPSARSPEVRAQPRDARALSIPPWSGSEKSGVGRRESSLEREPLGPFEAHPIGR